MDGFVQQLGLELVEQPPAERLRVAPGGGPPAERRSVIQSRLDKAARRTEKEVRTASPQPQPPTLTLALAVALAVAVALTLALTLARWAGCWRA